DQLFAGAALSLHEHGRVRRRDAREPRGELVHRGAAADERGEAGAAVEVDGEQLVRVDETPALERLLYAVRQLALFERLREVVIRAAAHRLDRALDAAVRGHHDDLR